MSPAPTFMQKEENNEQALPWLKDAAQLETDKAVDWVKALRATGAEQFSKTGLPTPAWEGWQYTNLRDLSQIKFHYMADPIKFDTHKIPEKLLEASSRIVLVNGQYQEQLSDIPKGVQVLSLMEAAEQGLEGLEEHLVTLGDLKEMPFKALNSAYIKDGFVLKVDAEVKLEESIEVLLYNIGSSEKAIAIYPRMLYWLGEKSQMTLLERHMGEALYLSNSYTSISLENESNLQLYKFEEESAEAFHFSSIHMQQQKNSQFEGFCFATGGRVAREEFQNELIDSQISSKLAGMYLLGGQQNHDFTILMDHFEPDGTSVQYFKGVVDDQARAVFQGKVHVRRFAQKTDGRQSHHALLLSDKAEANFRPELEIYADDVKCAHGATSGRLDGEGALFYMQSRGIPQAEARALLIEAFLSETLEHITSSIVKELYETRVRSWLASKSA